MNDDLNKALAELQRISVSKTEHLLAPHDEPFATILNAALSGDLIPRADADLAVALMVERAADIVGMCDQVGADAEGPVRALAPASALSELQALRDERDAIATARDMMGNLWVKEKDRAEAAEADITTYQQIVADMTQEAELAALRAQVERLTEALAVWHDGSRPIPFDRDTVGRMVREAWVRWAKTQPSQKPSWLVPYDELSEPDKEADRQIGDAVARWTLAFDAARAALTEGAAP